MKKTISANIGGILFYLEEEGYELLKVYLENLKQNVERPSSVEGIERKIAEVFLDKLSENKSFISVDDVKQLLVALGEDVELIASFAKRRSENEFLGRKETKDTETIFPKEPFLPKRLYRDTSRKMIGGVASGIAYYFEIDPFWVRWFFLLTFLDFLSDDHFFFKLAVLLYGTLWILMPANAHLPEPSQVRRFFRDPHERLIGGVCSGFSHFLGIDVVFVRMAFLISGFLGFGVIVYLVSWIIAPKATHMLSSYRPLFTLQDLEERIRKFFAQEESETEKKIVRLVLFPFRWIASLLEDFPKTSLHRLVNGMLALLGVAMMALAILSSVSLVLLAAYYLISFYTSEVPPLLFIFSDTGDVEMQTNRLLWDSIKHALSVRTVVSLLLAIGIPLGFLGIGGWSIFQRRWTISNRVSWSLGLVWVIGLIGTVVTVPMALVDFQAKGSYKHTITYSLPPSQKIYIQLNENYADDFLNVELTIVGHEKDKIELVQHYQSQGRNRGQAIEYAKNIEYQVQFNDSVFTFDKAIRLAEGIPFRGQHLKMKLFLPHQQPFYLSPNVAAILRQTLTPHGYKVSDLAENTVWVFDENGLQCVNCPTKKTAQKKQKQKNKKEVLLPSVEEFHKIHIEGNYLVSILPSDGYSVKAICGADVARINITQEDEKLIISEKESSDEDRRIQLLIHLPHLEELRLAGKIHAKLMGVEAKNLHVTLFDSTYLEATITTNNLSAYLSDHAKLVLTGKSQRLTLLLTGTSEVVADAFPSDKVTIEASDISKVNVNALQEIYINSGSHSLVQYVGEPDKIFIHQK